MDANRYLNLLSRVDTPSFSDIVDICTKLSPEKPLKHIQLRGHDIIDNENSLNAYISLYGKMHYEKLNNLLPELFKIFSAEQFNIIDWGCGQGVGSIAMIDYLAKNNINSCVKNILLIEPSKSALSRALFNVSTMYPIANIQSINNSINDIEYDEVIFDDDIPIIHILSNILDLESIDLNMLARNISLLNKEQFLVITNPCYSTTIAQTERFINYFTSHDVLHAQDITKREKNVYGYTSHSRLVKLPNALRKIEPYRTSNKAAASMSLLSFLSSIYEDYEDSHIVYNHFGTHSLPEIILFHKQKILLFDTCSLDDSIDIDILEQLGTAIHATNAKKFNFINEFRKHSLAPSMLNSFLYVNNVSRVQLDEKVVKLKDKLMDESKNKDEQKTYLDYVVLYCDENLHKQEIDQHLHNSQRYIPSYNNILEHFLPKQVSENRMYQYYDKKIQEKITSVANSRRKIKGDAGSGKTHILIHRAINSAKRTNSAVLILTFNITLINYIKQRFIQIGANYEAQSIHVINFHNLISNTYNYFDIQKPNKYSYRKFKETFQHLKPELKKYKSIFIDEAQDYESEWFNLILEFFASDDAELFVVADEKQTIYNRDHNKDQDKLPAIPTTRGRWEILKSQWRQNSQQLLNLMEDYQKKFYIGKYENEKMEDITYRTGVIESSFIKYYYFDNYKYNIDNITKRLIATINLFHKNYEGCTVSILSAGKTVLRKLNTSFIKKKVSTNLSILSEDEYNDIIKRYRKLDINNEKNTFNIKNDEQIAFIVHNKEREIKQNFEVKGNNIINISTVHSFKGWESDAVFIIINDSEHTSEQLDELIYTAFTRCRSYLYIINIGVNKYHDFFNSCSYIERH